MRKRQNYGKWSHFPSPQCMCMMTQRTPIFPAGCLSQARPGLGRGCSDPPKPFGPGVRSLSAARGLPDPLGHPGLSPEAEQQCLGVPWPSGHGTNMNQEHREGTTFPQFHRLGSKEGTGELKHPWLWGQCNHTCQRCFIFQSSTMVFSIPQLS